MKGVQNVVKPICNLAGTERNIYALIGRVSGTLKEAGLSDLADQFVHRSLPLDTYSEVLGLSQNYVELKDGR